MGDRLDGTINTEYEPYVDEALASAPNVVEAAKRAGVDPKTVIGRQIQAESSGNPNATSSKGARGLLQLLDSTAEEYGVTDPYDPRQNILGGVAYLDWLLQRPGVDGDIIRALAAYNGGLTHVRRHDGVPPFKETEAYVRKIAPELFGEAGPPPTAADLSLEVDMNAPIEGAREDAAARAERQAKLDQLSTRLAYKETMTNAYMRGLMTEEEVRFGVSGSMQGEAPGTLASYMRVSKDPLEFVAHVATQRSLALEQLESEKTLDSAFGSVMLRLGLDSFGVRQTVDAVGGFAAMLLDIPNDPNEVVADFAQERENKLAAKEGRAPRVFERVESPGDQLASALTQGLDSVQTTIADAATGSDIESRQAMRDVLDSRSRPAAFAGLGAEIVGIIGMHLALKGAGSASGAGLRRASVLVNRLSQSAPRFAQIDMMLARLGHSAEIGAQAFGSFATKEAAAAARLPFTQARTLMRHPKDFARAAWRMGMIDLAGGAVGAYAVADEDATAMDYIMGATGGAMAAHLGASWLIGRPFGPVARGMNALYLTNAPIAGADANAARAAVGWLGKSKRAQATAAFGWRNAVSRAKGNMLAGLATVPRATVGNLIGAAKLGGAWKAGVVYDETGDSEQAIAAGLHEALLWAGTDYAFMRLGRLHEPMRMMAIGHKQAINMLLEMGVRSEPLLRTLAAGMQAASVVPGAAGGAAIAGGAGAAFGMTQGSDAVQGALLGAGAAVGGLLSARAAGNIMRLSTMVDEKTLIEILNGRWGRLTKNEIEGFVEALSADVIRDTMVRGGTNDVAKAIAPYLVGTYTLNKIRANVLAENLKTQTENLSVLGALEEGGVPSWDPRVLKAAADTYALREEAAALTRDMFGGSRTAFAKDNIDDYTRRIIEGSPGGLSVKPLDDEVAAALRETQLNATLDDVLTRIVTGQPRNIEGEALLQVHGVGLPTAQARGIMDVLAQDVMSQADDTGMINGIRRADEVVADLESVLEGLTVSGNFRRAVADDAVARTRSPEQLPATYEDLRDFAASYGYQMQVRPGGKGKFDIAILDPAGNQVVAGRTIKEARDRFIKALDDADVTADGARPQQPITVLEGEAPSMRQYGPVKPGSNKQRPPDTQRRALELERDVQERGDDALAAARGDDVVVEGGGVVPTGGQRAPVQGASGEVTTLGQLRDWADTLGLTVETAVVGERPSIILKTKKGGTLAQGTTVREVLDRIPAAYRDRVPRNPRRLAPQPVTVDEVRGLLDSDLSLETLQTYAKRHGLRVTPSSTSSGRVYNVVTMGSKGKPPRVIDSFESLLAAGQFLHRITTQRGSAQLDNMLSIGGGLFGAAIGGATGSLIVGQLADKPEYAKNAFIGGAVAGGIAAYALIARISRGAINLPPAEKRILDIVVPDIDKLADDAAEVTKGLGKVDLKRDTFLRMSAGKQVEHIRAALKSVRERKTERVNGKNVGVTKDRRVKLFNRVLQKFTPFVLQNKEYDEILTEVVQTGKALGMADDDIMTMWRGYLENMATPFERRPMSRRTSLFDLGREMGHQFRDLNTWDELKQVADAASVIAGPAHTYVQHARLLNGMLHRLALSPAAENLKKYVDLASEDLGAQLAATSLSKDVDVRMFSSVRMIESLRTSLDHRLKVEPDSPVYNELRDIFTSLVETQNHMQAAHADNNRKIATIFKPLAGRFDLMEKVGYVLEGGKGETAAQWRAKLETQNKIVVQVADDLKQFFDDWANRLGIPQAERITDYLPWVYSQRSIADIARSGGLMANEPLLGLNTGRWATSKLFRHMLPRTAVEPITTRITDPFELAQIYAHGATRKFYLDQLYTRAPADTLRALGKHQPFMVRDIASLIRTMHGVPDNATLRIRAKVRSLGIDLAQTWGIFDEDSFLASAIDWGVDTADPEKLARVARSFQMYSKIGYNLMSSAVNLTQHVINGGADARLMSILSTHWENLQGMLAEGGERVGLSKFAMLVDPKSRGRDLRNVMRSEGIWGEAFLREFNEMSIDYALSQGARARLIAPSATVGFAGGVVGGTVIGDETGWHNAVPGVIGAGLGIAAARYQPAFIARALGFIKSSALFTFDAVEKLNRTAVYGAAQKDARRARWIEARVSRLRRSGRGAEADALLQRLQRNDRLADAAIAAGGFGAFGAVDADEGERIEGFVKGSIVGAALAAPGLIAGEGTTMRTLREREALRGRKSFFRKVDKDFATGPIWDADRGIGGTPMQADLAGSTTPYYGFTKEMTVKEFLALNPTRDTPSAYLKKAVENGKPIAPPYLQVNWNDKLGRWDVVGHEGRGRALAIADVYGADTVIPVDFFPRNTNGKLHNRGINVLTPQQRAAQVSSDSRASASKVIRPRDVQARTPAQVHHIKDYDQMVMDAVPTAGEVDRWYAHQVNEMTNFRYGKTSRGEFMRGSGAEAFFALQSYTLNQMEFLGARSVSYFRTLLKRMSEGTGNVDMRFVRHAGLVAATSAMYAALFNGMSSGKDRSPTEFAARMGFGFLPFVRYNADSDTWQVLDFAQAITGPMSADIHAVAKHVIWPLMTEKGSRSFDRHLDALAQQLFAFVRGADKAATGDALGVSAMAEGMTDLLRETGLAGAVGTPATTLTGGAPRHVGQPVEPQGGTSKFKGMSGGGFQGFNEGGGF